MGNYNRNNFGNRGFNNDREMHQAVCDSCGKNCLLPFRPNGRKPVYCSDCFKKNSGGADMSPRRSSFNKRPDYGNRPDFERKNDFKPQNNEQFEMINRKLDRISEMLKESLAMGKKETPVKPAETAAIPKKTKKLKKETPVTTD